MLNVKIANLGIFAKYLIALVDHINIEKQLVHLLINENIDCTTPISHLNFDVKFLDVLSVKLSQHLTKDGKKRYKLHQIEKSDIVAPNYLVREFTVPVRISNMMGFTDSDIFIEPHLVEQHAIQNGATVSGVALKSYNKKKNSWGWKAAQIINVDNSTGYIDDDF